MIGHLNGVLSLLPIYGPVLLAFAMAWGGSILFRRQGWAEGLVSPLAAAVSWVALVPGGWRWVFAPRAGVEWLVAPAVGFVLSAALETRLRSRWVPVVALSFASWWLARSPMGRPEYFRVLFGALLLAWLLRRLEAQAPQRAAAAALTICFGLLLGIVPLVWILAMAVLVGCCAGVSLGGGGSSIVPGLTMVGLVAAEMAGGRLMRGSFGTVDLAFFGAIGTPVLVSPLEGVFRRRLGGAAPVGAIVAAAGIVAGMAWLVARALPAGAHR